MRPRLELSGIYCYDNIQVTLKYINDGQSCGDENRYGGDETPGFPVGEYGFLSVRNRLTGVGSLLDRCTYFFLSVFLTGGE